MTSDASWSTKLRTIGDLERGDHTFLRSEHTCAYFGEFSARKGYKHSTANQIVLNLKKSPDKRGAVEWQYKDREIIRVGKLIRANLPAKVIKDLTIIPAPPSKAPSHPLHDDRMERIARTIGDDVDVRCLLSTGQSRTPAHHSDNRPGPDDLEQGLVWHHDEAARKSIGSMIIVLDDVLVTGATFVACSRVLSRQCPQSRVYGLFVARRVPERSAAADEFFDMADP